MCLTRQPHKNKNCDWDDNNVSHKSLSGTSEGKVEKKKQQSPAAGAVMDMTVKKVNDNIYGIGLIGVTPTLPMMLY